MILKFAMLKVGAAFTYNGNDYIKCSTRTAIISEFAKRFYFPLKAMVTTG